VDLSPPERRSREAAKARCCAFLLQHTAQQKAPFLVFRTVF